MLWSSITNRRRHTKINEPFKKICYNCILQHPQVVQSPIFNDCLKVSIYFHSEPQVVPKFPLQVSVWELHNSKASPPEDGGRKDSIDASSNIIISDYMLCSILPPQLRKMSARYKVVCGCECYIYTKNIHSSLLSWCYRYLKNLKYLSQNAQNRRSGEMANSLFETYETL